MARLLGNGGLKAFASKKGRFSLGSALSKKKSEGIKPRPRPIYKMPLFYQMTHGLKSDSVMYWPYWQHGIDVIAELRRLRMPKVDRLRLKKKILGYNGELEMDPWRMLAEIRNKPIDTFESELEDDTLKSELIVEMWNNCIFGSELEDDTLESESELEDDTLEWESEREYEDTLTFGPYYSEYEE